MFDALKYFRPEYKPLIILYVSEVMGFEELKKKTGLAESTLNKYLNIHRVLGYIDRKERGVYAITSDGRRHVEKILAELEQMINYIRQKKATQNSNEQPRQIVVSNIWR